jgi:D-3-phosphoglycerate dehydrogenase
VNVVFIDTVHEVLSEDLTAAGYSCINATGLSALEIKKRFPDANAFIVRSRFPMNEGFLSHFKNLKFIGRSGAGMENIDEAYCKAHNIMAFNAPEGNRTAVAEHAIGMLLSLFNKLNSADRDVKQGKWEREENRGIEISGKTVGIIGCGNNGNETANLFAAFGAKVLAYDKYKSEYPFKSSLKEIFKQADILSLHIPQTEETRFWVDRSFLEQFEKPIYLINLSRGKIVVLKDLLDLLLEGRVLGACLDVLEYESSSFEDNFLEKENQTLNNLLKHPRVMLSPHVGGWTKESYYKLSKVLSDKILAHFGKQP